MPSGCVVDGAAAEISWTLSAAAMTGGAMRYPVLRLVVELDREGDEGVREEGGKREAIAHRSDDGMRGHSGQFLQRLPGFTRHTGPAGSGCGGSTRRSRAAPGEEPFPR